MSARQYPIGPVRQEWSREDAIKAGRLTDALVATRDRYRAAGQTYIAVGLQAVIDLPTGVLVNAALAIEAELAR